MPRIFKNPISSEEEGIAISNAAIERAKKRNADELDLSQLKLKKIPPSLFKLCKLKRLYLGLSRRPFEKGDRERYQCRNKLSGKLSGLVQLPALENLDVANVDLVSFNEVPLIYHLKSLDVSDNPDSDATPLARFEKLEQLFCDSTNINDITPLANLKELRVFSCCHSPIADIKPLSRLKDLFFLNIMDTHVQNLEPLSELSKLKHLDCSLCKLESLPDSVLWSPALEELRLHRTRLPNVPDAVLSQHLHDNCLTPLREHMCDLGAGAATLSDVKVLVLGNGGVGKTQLIRRLRNECFESSWDSTHGVTITDVFLTENNASESTRLHLWDFGGQDIYHGTHSLFARTLAVYIICWSQDRENDEVYSREGLSFRNHPLQYWVDYVRHHAAAGSPILILQTKCDTLADDVVNAPFDRTSLNAFACPPQELRTSARTGRGHLALFEALQQAVAWLRDPMRMGLPKIGAGRLRVQRRLEALREADSARPPQAREHRLLTQDLFRAICDEEGGINSRKALLAYLHNAGTVFYWPGLFGDRIVLDQAWALDGVYTVFQRTACHRELRRLHGRFTRPLLALLAWQDRHKSEQDLFLAMMQACGITFVHDIGLAQEPEYVAPDLLPDRTAVASDLAVWWPADQPVESATFAYGFLHDGLIRAIIARIGSEARINGLYWKGGLCLYETTTQSRGLIEQEMTGRWEGLIHVQTQGGQAETLLNRLCRLVEQEQERTGLEFAEAYRQPLHAAREEERPMSYGQPPVEEPEWYVSYAWGDQTDAGKERTRVVDELCARAEARGIRVLRDKNEVQVGDSIGRFMRRLGKGDRVFVILSEKYLRSPSCMFELFEIWRTSQAEGEAFLERVRIFALPDTRFDRPIDRVRHAAHWNAQKTELQQAIEEHGPAVLGERDFADYKLMLDFAHNVSDILAVMADIRRPRTLDELERYGFDDPPPASGT